MILIKRLYEICELWDKPLIETLSSRSVQRYYLNSSDSGLTSQSPLREILRVYSQPSTHEFIRVKQKIDTTNYLVLLDTKYFKGSKAEKNKTKAMLLYKLFWKFKESFLMLDSFINILYLNISTVPQYWIMLTGILEIKRCKDMLKG